MSLNRSPSWSHCPKSGLPRRAKCEGGNERDFETPCPSELECPWGIIFISNHIQQSWVLLWDYGPYRLFGVFVNHLRPLDIHFWTKTYFGPQKHLLAQLFYLWPKRSYFYFGRGGRFPKFYCTNRRRSWELKNNHQKTCELGSQNFFLC